MLFDLHVHSSHSSCSRLQPEDILHKAEKRGLDGVCITDHHSMAVHRDFKEGIQSNGLCLIFGMEYTTPEGDFLLFGPFEELVDGLDANALLNHVRETGGVAVAAHPFRKNRLTSETLIRKGLCRIVEGVNGRNSLNQNMKTTDWQQQYGVRLAGGSDAHTLEELGTITTRLTTRVKSRAEFITALQSGHFEEVIPTSSSTSRQPNQSQATLSGPRPGKLAEKPVHLHSDGIAAQ